ncbi:MAG: NHL repeat-containing protein [Candidatus Binataceae bacterium]
MTGSSPLSSPTVLYLVALSGNAGHGSNTAIGLMGVAGMSNALPGSVTINELTTVAAESALAQFIDSTGQVIGAPSSNATGFANAVNQAQADLADISSGGPASFWSNQGVTEASCTGGSPPVNCDGLERMDTIANILAACVESSGPFTACSTLLSHTGSGSTTLQAAHVMATSPTANVSTLFALQSGSPPFTPALSSAPDGWEIGLNFTPSGANFDLPLGVAIDAAGNVWVANSGNNSVTELTSSGGLAGNFLGGGNFNGPWDVAIDGSGNAWVTNSDGNSVTELTSIGSLAGNFLGGGFNVPIGVAIDAAGNVWVANRSDNNVIKLTSSGAVLGSFSGGGNFNSPYGVAIDASGGVWVTSAGGGAGCSSGAAPCGSVTVLNSNGSLAGNFAGGLNTPVGVAIDAAGNVWVANLDGGAGCSSAAAPCGSVTKLSPTGATLGNFLGGGDFLNPRSVAIDGAGNAWVPNENGNSVIELTSGGATLDNFAPSGANISSPFYLAIDAAGNVWAPNEDNNSVSELLGAARPVLTSLVACLTQATPAAVCLP